MRRIPILQIGLGGVGQALVEQVLHFNQNIGGRLGVRFSYIGLADRQGAIVDDDRIPPSVLLSALEAKRAGESLASVPEGGQLIDWRNLLTPSPCVIVDVTAQDRAEDALAEAVQQGHRIVLANKKPLCGSYETFQALTSQGQTRYEATVGAGLPVISTLRSLLDTGDTIAAIDGCLSGTLGFLMTQLEDGVAYSDAVRDARQRGWTEPDPRDDLSGTDVARKALILARTSGFPIEMQDVPVELLYPEDMASLPLDQFLDRLGDLDAPYRSRTADASAQGLVLRYVAHVSRTRVQIGVVAAEPASPVGSLRGPDNLVVFQTRRYNERALRVSGPGAGTDVTAAGVLHDLIVTAVSW